MKIILLHIVQAACNAIDRTKVQSNADCPNPLYGFLIQNKKRVRNSTFEDTTIKHIVTFIIHKDHVVATPWGDRTFHLGPDNNITLPRLCRKRSFKELWNKYIRTTISYQN